MDAKHRVDKLLVNKRKIEQEIDNIQSKCNHPNKVIKQVQITNTSFNPRWTCEDCYKILGYPTEFELNKVNFFGKKH